MGGGKVEIQNQDCHFPTAPIACGARKKPGRLHKLLDAPFGRMSSTEPTWYAFLNHEYTGSVPICPVAFPF